MEMLGSSGILDDEYTQTNVDYTKFGNFAQAGKRPNVVAGQTAIETEETVKNTGLSDLFSMGGSLLSLTGSAFETADAALRSGGAEVPGAQARADIATTRLENKEAKRRQSLLPINEIEPMNIGNNGYVSIMGLGGTPEDYYKYRR